MAQPKYELVLRREYEDGRFRLNMTPRRAWGFCYGAILREMHIRKLDALPLGDEALGERESVRPVISAQFDLAHGRTVHVDDEGVWVRYGRSFRDITTRALTSDLEEIVCLARWYGPFDQRTYEKFLHEARPHEVPHVRMPAILERERNWLAVHNVFGPA